MQKLPHRYVVAANANPSHDVTVEGRRLPPLLTATPAEFGGPGDRWSPETLLVASVADCFALTFRAVASASKLPWVSLRCEVEGDLGRGDHGMRFSAFRIRAELRVPEGTDPAEARRLLVRAEQACLVTNSLKAETVLNPDVIEVAPAATQVA